MFKLYVQALHSWTCLFVSAQVSFCFVLWQTASLSKPESEPKLEAVSLSLSLLSLCLWARVSPSLDLSPCQCPLQTHVMFHYQNLLVFLFKSQYPLSLSFLGLSSSLSPSGSNLFPPALCRSHLFLILLWNQSSTIQSLWAKSTCVQVLVGMLGFCCVPLSCPSLNCVFSGIFHAMFCVPRPLVALSELTSSRDHLTSSSACPAAPHSFGHSVNTGTSSQPVFARLWMLPSCWNIPAVTVTCTWLLAFLRQSIWNCSADFTACRQCGWQS